MPDDRRLDADPETVAALLDGIPGAYERAELSRQQIAAGARALRSSGSPTFWTPDEDTETVTRARRPSASSRSRTAQATSCTRRPFA